MRKISLMLIEFTASFNLGLVHLKGRIYEVKKSVCPMFSGTA